jgi:hypothetical protein
MELSEIAAIRRLSERHRLAAERRSTARTRGITLVAAFQFLKCAVLLLTATLLQMKPQMVNGPSSPLYPLVYVATRGRFDSLNTELHGGSALFGLILFLGLYSGLIGIGLLDLNAWARRTLIFSSGITLLLFEKSRIWPDPAAVASPNMTNMYLLFAVDACVFIYLLRGSTAEVFRKRTQH